MVLTQFGKNCFNKVIIWDCSMNELEINSVLEMLK